MFWRFGFHNASSIDSLLDKEDVSLEAILDEDELLQECKAQNTRLIDYFQRVDVLQRLLGYVTGRIEGEGRGRFKYPYVATEVLCSEIWSIVETCISPSNNLLTTFWETVLDRPAEDMKIQMVMASQFTKINSVFLSKKPTEVLAFIQAQPNVVERLLRHIETPAFADLLVRVIQLDEIPSCSGVLDWLSKENLMSRLLDLLSPSHSPDMHTVVAELIKGIISMAAPSPGAGLGSDSLSNGPASNKFARELASRDSVTKLVGYILTDYVPPAGAAETPASETTDDDMSHEHENEAAQLPNRDSTASSVVQSICIIIELIRQNNSDYFEPYLFHTLRNRLIQVQQHLQMHTQDGRDTLERAMMDMVNRMGVVHLGPVLQLMCDKLDDLQRYLREPRSINGPVLTTVGSLKPLTFERYRICELYAELLHCSNMSLLNRPSEFDHLYDDEGRLQGGLSALEELAQVIAIGAGNDRDDDNIDDDENEDMEPAHEFPVSAAHESSSLDSDDDMSGDSSDDDAMEDISMYDDPHSLTSSTSSLPENPLERFPSATLSSSPMSSPSLSNHLTPVQSRLADSAESLARPRSSNSRRSSSRRSSRRSTLQETTPQLGAPSIVLGERLKVRFLESNVASTLLDLFFEYPWNNFLHSVVYDLIHQVLTGRIDTGYNRELTVSLFRDALLMHRIIEGSKRNDIESAKPKGVRLGYMGHLTLISEDVINSLEHFPPDLRLVVAQYAPQPEWDEYVTGRYKETKKKDTSLLGGGKPVIAAGMRNGASQWKVDEAEPSASSGPSTTHAKQEESEGGRGEFRRDVKTVREGSADFGAARMDDDDDDDFQGPPQFARYLAQEMQSGEHMFDGEGSDDDEDDSGWLAHSNFDLRPPPITARQHEVTRQPLSSSAFEDSFDPGSSSTSDAPYTDPFDDDAFGPFADSAAADGSEPFNFSSSMSEDVVETSFDGFGDFGDFQSAGSGSLTLEDNGTLTPTADSWSFTSISSTGSEDDSIGRLSESPQDSEIRTA
ncbi:SIT4 phosphatase-associated protein-domain-containing protein [Cytidiella melzeri]|nr:SIT4 phosphatase-associated protein-domain-containing protein [Cytidiella melzeri]